MPMRRKDARQEHGSPIVARVPLGRKILCGTVALSMCAMMMPATALAYSSWEAEYEVYTPVSEDWVDTSIDGISKGENGVRIETGDGGHAKVVVDGGISVEEDAMDVDAKGEGTLSQLEVKGDVETGDDGINAYSDNGGTAKVTVDGTVTTDDDAITAGAEQPNSGTDVTVNGDVTAGYWALDCWAADAGKTTITVNGNVSTTGEHTAAILGVGDGGILDVKVNGNIVSPKDGAELSAESDLATPSTEDQSVLKLSVVGDISTAREGIYAYSDEDDAILDALVTGTLKGGSAGVAIDADGKELTEACFDLTVWKIETGDGGILVANGDYKNDDPVYTANDEFSAKIKYIVKVEQPAAGATVSATDAEGNALDTSHDFDYALEGDKVLLKVNLDPGYKLTGAFNGLGEKTELLMDDAGNYYVVVPRGGGVYLSVETALIDYKVTFVNDDGKELTSDTYHYGDMPAYKGETPTKASDDTYDYEFIGWTPEIDKVTGDITYKATFKAIEKKSDDPVPADDEAKTTTSVSGTVPKLADTEGMPAALIALIAGGAIVALACRRESA